MKPKLGSILLLLLVWIVSSCNEEASVQNDSATFNQVSAWLDTQKEKFADDGSRQAITDLQANLIGRQLRKEVLTEKESVIIIPLKNEFQTVNISDRPSLKSLVLVENENGEFQASHIVEVIPEGQHYDKLPVNLISDVYSFRDCGLNGIFSVMSITNHLVYEKEFKDGKFYALSYFQRKESEKGGGRSGAERTKTCIDWYWKTWVNGVLTYEDYAFTTCDDCQITRTHSSGRAFNVECEGDGGGGSGSGDQSYTEEESITASGVEGDPADTEGIAPQINYYYYAYAIRARPSGQIIAVTIASTVVTNPISTYVDRYGRNTIRSIGTGNDINTWIPLTPFSALIEWTCTVQGTWVYTDGSPTYTRTWINSHMEVH